MTRLSSFLFHRSRNSLTLWLLAGGYLVYLAYTLLRDAGETAAHVWGIYLSAAVFGLVGLALLAVSLLALKNGWYSEKLAADEHTADTALPSADANAADIDSAEADMFPSAANDDVAGEP